MIAQRTEEWYEARLGKVTASRMKDVMAYGAKGQPLKIRDDYKKELVAERLTHQPANPDQYVSYEMKWGMAYEAVARTRYELSTGNKVDDAPFVEHETLMAGASPDGFVGKEGLLEIKCMKTSNQLYSCFIDHEYPEEFKPQMMMQMWITGREWVDFVAYDPRLPDGLDLFVQRVVRDEDYINMIEAEATTFLEEIDRNVGYFMGLLPIKERTCRECGLVFADRVPKCNACGSTDVATNFVAA